METEPRGTVRGTLGPRLKPTTRTRMLAAVDSPANARASRSWLEVPAGRLVRLAPTARLGAVAVLLVFHAALLWAHLASGRLFEPAVALRWGIGFLLLGLLVALRRVGVPVLYGRRALVVWVLLALLHVSAAMPATSAALTTNGPSGITLTLVVLPQASGMAFAAGLLPLGATLARAWRLPQPVARPVRRDREARLRSRRIRPRLAPRAPPAPVTC
jgi:hypothetical protein